MTHSKLEYIWIGGEGELRSKTKVVHKKVSTLDDVPSWNFDGSSTKQATGDDSEVFLKPVKISPDPFRDCESDYLVLCECYLPDGETPHETNNRYKANQVFQKCGDVGLRYGLEMEMGLLDLNTGKPLGMPSGFQVYPRSQGPYYCSVGANNAHARVFLEKALDNALKAGLNITGFNCEVLCGQAEIQVDGMGIDAADQHTLLRYISHRTGEQVGCLVTFEPKYFYDPEYAGDANSSGLHMNFSYYKMMNEPEEYKKAIERLSCKHKEFILISGKGNEKRLCGALETSNIDDFSSGVADRGSSIRIPRETDKNKKGYIEDRRPASSACPYQITSFHANVCILESSSCVSS